MGIIIFWIIMGLLITIAFPATREGVKAWRKDSYSDKTFKFAKTKPSKPGRGQRKHIGFSMSDADEALVNEFNAGIDKKYAEEIKEWEVEIKAWETEKETAQKAFKKENEARLTKGWLKTAGGISGALAAFTMLMSAINLTTTINANEVGIVYDQFNNGLQEETLGEGLHLLAPGQKITTISTAIHTETFEVMAQTGKETQNVCTDHDNKPETPDECNEIVISEGGQFVTYEITLNYRIPANEAGLYYRTFANTAPTRQFVQGKLLEQLQYASTNYGVFEIMAGAVNDVRNDAYKTLGTELETDYIDLTGMQITDVDAGSEIENIIIEKANAQAQIEIANLELEAARIRMEQELAQANNDAERAAIEAAGAAEADKLIREVTIKVIEDMYKAQFDTDADQDAFENGNTTNAHMTKQEIANFILTTIYYETWDGQLPSVIVGDDGSIIIDVPTDQE